MKICLVGVVLSHVDRHDEANRTCCNYVSMPKTVFIQPHYNVITLFLLMTVQSVYTTMDFKNSH